MQVHTETRSVAVQVIALEGRLDALEAGPLRQTLAELHANGEHFLVVDLRNIEFVDSAGLAALVKGMKDARTAGGDLRLIRSAHADAERVFSLTKFDQVFEMADDPTDLLNGF